MILDTILVDFLYDVFLIILNDYGKWELRAKLDELDELDSSPVEKLRAILEVAHTHKLIGES